MQPIFDSVAVPLDVLNNHYQSLARYEARLLDMHGDWATLTLPGNAPVSCLHWGSLVRFMVSEGDCCCQAEGVVVAHRLLSGEPSEADAISGSISSLATTSAGVAREITVHLWQCRQMRERREGQRRWPRIPVLLRPVAQHRARVPVLERFSDPEEECWERGWAMDLSANGMRLRAHVALPMQQRVALQFALPASSHTPTEAPTRRFTLMGRILRSERTRAASSHEAMICFEHLVPEDGLALSRFLNS